MATIASSSSSGLHVMSHNTCVYSMFVFEYSSIMFLIAVILVWGHFKNFKTMSREMQKLIYFPFRRVCTSFN